MKEQLTLMKMATETGLQILPERQKEIFLKKMKTRKEKVITNTKKVPSEKA